MNDLFVSFEAHGDVVPYPDTTSYYMQLVADYLNWIRAIEDSHLIEFVQKIWSQTFRLSANCRMCLQNLSLMVEIQLLRHLESKIDKKKKFKSDLYFLFQICLSSINKIYLSLSSIIKNDE